MTYNFIYNDKPEKNVPLFFIELKIYVCMYL